MLISFFLTLSTLVVPILSVLLIGLPIALILIEKKYNWALAPYFGLAFIVILLQNLVFLGITVRQSFFYVWIIAGIFWIGIIKSGHIKKIVFPSKKLVLIALLIYLLHSLGLVYLGPEYYIGRGWYDQLSYVSAAQFLMDHALPGADMNQLIHHPSAQQALLFIQQNRIGEIIFQSFVACSLFSTAKSAFEPVILMMPFFLVFSIYTIARNFLFNESKALFLAGLGASLPSIALIHLESAISHALILPLFLIWPCLVDDLLVNPTIKKMIGTSLLLGLAISVYTEFAILFFVLLLFSALWVGKISKNLAILLGLMVVSLLLNIGFFHGLFSIAIRSMHSLRDWQRIYPWAHSINGLVRIWIGDFDYSFTGLPKRFIELFFSFLILLGYVGFLVHAIRKQNLLSFSYCLLVLLPWVLWVIAFNSHGYQFYKLLLTVSPLFPLGIALALAPIYTMHHFFQGVLDGGRYLLYVTVSCATLFMILTSTQVEGLAYTKRGVGYKLLASDTREALNKLERFSSENILIQWQDTFRQGDFINGWLCYFLRNNYVWLTNPRIGDSNLKSYLPTIENLPKSYLLVTSNNIKPNGFYNVKIWGNNTYSIWKINQYKF